MSSLLPEANLLVFLLRNVFLSQLDILHIDISVFLYLFWSVVCFAVLRSICKQLAILQPNLLVSGTSPKKCCYLLCEACATFRPEKEFNNWYIDPAVQWQCKSNILAEVNGTFIYYITLTLCTKQGRQINNRNHLSVKSRVRHCKKVAACRINAIVYVFQNCKQNRKFSFLNNNKCVSHKKLWSIIFKIYNGMFRFKPKVTKGTTIMPWKESSDTYQNSFDLHWTEQHVRTSRRSNFVHTDNYLSLMGHKYPILYRIIIHSCCILVSVDTVTVNCVYSDLNISFPWTRYNYRNITITTES